MSSFSPESERPPRFITRGAFMDLWRRNADLTAQLAEFQDLAAYLRLGRMLMNDVNARIANGETLDMAHDQAYRAALEQEEELQLEALRRDYRSGLSVILEEIRKQELLAEFVVTEQPRIDEEVIATIAAREVQIRANFARDEEARLRNLKTEELLEEIGSDEAQRVLERMQATSLLAAERTSLISLLKEQANGTGLIDIASLPQDILMTVGLREPTQVQGGGRIIHNLPSCERVLTIRAIDPPRGILRVEQDSWQAHTDALRRAAAIPDQTLARMAIDPDRYLRAQIGINNVPGLLPFHEGQPPFQLYGHETKVVTIFDELVLQSNT